MEDKWLPLTSVREAQHAGKNQMAYSIPVKLISLCDCILVSRFTNSYYISCISREMLCLASAEISPKKNLHAAAAAAAAAARRLFPRRSRVGGGVPLLRLPPPLSLFLRLAKTVNSVVGRSPEDASHRFPRSTFSVQT